jgi:hypothetical protein
MTRYDYYSAIATDVQDFIKWEGIEVNHENRHEVAEELNEQLWCNDSVTGNGSGSYTFNAWQADENLCHNMELLAEACEEFGGNLGEWIEKGSEYCDVCIRCYLLRTCIEYAIEGLLQMQN